MTTPLPARSVLTQVACAIAAFGLTLQAPLATAADAPLQGWAIMPANTFSDGPTSGQFATGSGGNPLPLVNKQPVQGFSGVLAGAKPGSYLFMTDNGFGTQGNSADTLLRVYGVTPDFKTKLGGTGTVSAADYTSGASLPAFSAASRITLADPNRQLGFTLQADYANYYNQSSNPAVDASIKAGRLLTGADLDIEAMRKDKNGNLWFGDEFGPFLVKTNAAGTVLRKEVALPGVMSPQNPYLNGGTANLGGSRGFEGMAINPAGDRLFTLLEGTVAGDAVGTLRINAFDVNSESFTGQQWSYKLATAGTNIGDMTAINDHEFLIIERNGATATGGGTPFKKVYKIDLDVTESTGNLVKTEVVDLMNIADPDDLNGDSKTTFTFPFVTIESLLILDPQTLLIANDNNYPGIGGRDLNSDNTEFLLIHLANPVPEPGTWALWMAGLGGLVAMTRRRRGFKA